MNQFKHSTQTLSKYIEKYLIRYRKYLFSVSINLTILFIISIALQVLDLFSVHKFIDLKLSAWIITVLDIIALRLHQKTAKNTIVKDFFKYGFLILLVTQLFKGHLIIESLNTLNTYLMVLTIVFGAITFCDNPPVIAKKENEQKLKEEEIYKKEFALKYPNINKIPILRDIIKWQHKEDMQHIITLLLVLSIGILNRIIHLGTLPLHQDESFVFSTSLGLNYTDKLVRYNLLNDTPYTEYTRNFIYTYIVHFFNNVLGYNEFATRLPGALMGILALFVVYYIAIEVFKNKNTALLVTFLFSVNDILIYFSRFARGYSFLILISLLIFYYSYKIIQIKNHGFIKNNIILILLFAIGMNFHLSIFLLLPMHISAISYNIFNRYPFKKYSYIYSIIGCLTIFLTMELFSITRYIHSINYGHFISLNIDFANYNIAYIHHLFRAFNNYEITLIAMILGFIIMYKYNPKLSILFTTGILFPLIASFYAFSIYEDFRYFLVIQPIFVFFISYILYNIHQLFSNNFILKNRLVTLVILFLIIPLQIPHVPEIKPFTLKAQSDWVGFEGERLHRRAAIPELYKAYNFIFENDTDFIIMVVSHGGIYWDNSVYLSKYRDKYPNTTFVIFKEQKYYSTKFKELYNSQESSHRSNNLSNKYLRQDVEFDNILKMNKTIYAVAPLRHLTNKEIMKYLDNNCNNLAKNIGIHQFNYFENYKYSENNYFPNVFMCNQL